MISKFTFDLLINGVSYADKLCYPLTFTDKLREESFNTAVAKLTRTTRSTPFRPNKKATLKIIKDGEVESHPMLILNGVVSEMGQSNLFSHQINLIEYTYRFEKVILPETTITRIVGSYEPTLKDVAEKILNRAAEITREEYSLDVETSLILDTIPSPE